MGKVHRLPSTDNAERDASTWFARMNADDVTPDDRARFEAWLGANAVNAKAYSELEHEGLLELRQGSGAFVSVKRSTRSQISRVHEARSQVRKLVGELRELGLNDDEIRRVVEAELFHPAEVMSKR